MRNEADCIHWFGLMSADLDCPHWLPYLDAEMIGETPSRKITIEYRTEEDNEASEGTTTPTDDFPWVA